MHGLATVPEHAEVRDGALTLHGGVRGQHHALPWQSPAVMELAHTVGRSSAAAPMLIEGPVGTVMAAIGEQRDHAVAGHALTQAMRGQLDAKLQRAGQALQHTQPSGAPAQPPPSGAGDRHLPPAVSGHQHSGGITVALSAGGALAPKGRARRQAAFGAVYEYRDRAGRPQFVAGTARAPEEAYGADYRDHAGVRGLFEGDDASEHGRAKVVWVGVGGGPCGHAEMAAARTAVARERASRQRISELQGAKPYSSHAHVMARVST